MLFPHVNSFVVYLSPSPVLRPTTLSTLTPNSATTAHRHLSKTLPPDPYLLALLSCCVKKRKTYLTPRGLENTLFKVSAVYLARLL